jgi:hypothetical protein
MFDAEIAAKLLNRAMSKTSDEGCGRYLDVLHEGLLDFSHRIARVTVDDSSNDVPLEIELLTFRDASQALRIRTGHTNARWSEWVSTTQVSNTQSLDACIYEPWPLAVRRLSLSDAF